mmetsp:Transcript_147781/g.275409  ORF Transcript_147781/g.275409 Transcript_147781/m.275409 type:complete len:234 (-) Transcript_147781:546-1247(-)
MCECRGPKNGLRCFTRSSRIATCVTRLWRSRSVNATREHRLWNCELIQCTHRPLVLPTSHRAAKPQWQDLQGSMPPLNRPCPSSSQWTSRPWSTLMRMSGSCRTLGERTNLCELSLKMPTWKLPRLHLQQMPHETPPLKLRLQRRRRQLLPRQQRLSLLRTCRPRTHRTSCSQTAIWALRSIKPQRSVNQRRRHCLPPWSSWSQCSQPCLWAAYQACPSCRRRPAKRMAACAP